MMIVWYLSLWIDSFFPQSSSPFTQHTTEISHIDRCLTPATEYFCDGFYAYEVTDGWSMDSIKEHALQELVTNTGNIFNENRLLDSKYIETSPMLCGCMLPQFSSLQDSLATVCPRPRYRLRVSEHHHAVLF